eukprot:EG_transcript_21761
MALPHAKWQPLFGPRTTVPLTPLLPTHSFCFSVRVSKVVVVAFGAILAGGSTPLPLPLWGFDPLPLAYPPREGQPALWATTGVQMIAAVCRSAPHPYRPRTLMCVYAVLHPACFGWLV